MVADPSNISAFFAYRRLVVGAPRRTTNVRMYIGAEYALVRYVDNWTGTISAYDKSPIGSILTRCRSAWLLTGEHSMHYLNFSLSVVWIIPPRGEITYTER